MDATGLRFGSSDVMRFTGGGSEGRDGNEGSSFGSSSDAAAVVFEGSLAPSILRYRSLRSLLFVTSFLQVQVYERRVSNDKDQSVSVSSWPF